MICEQCLTGGGHQAPGRRGWRYETGHWYHSAWGNMGDQKYKIRLARWLTVTILVKPYESQFSGGPRCSIMLGCGHEINQMSRIEMEGCDIVEAKRRALDLAIRATEYAAATTKSILADLPGVTIHDESSAIKKMRARIAKAQTTLDAVRAKYRKEEIPTT